MNKAPERQDRSEISGQERALIELPRHIVEKLLFLKHRNLPELVLKGPSRIEVSLADKNNLLSQLSLPLKKNFLLSLLYQLACLACFLDRQGLELTEPSGDMFSVERGGRLVLQNLSALSESSGFCFFDSYLNLARLLATGKKVPPTSALREINPLLSDKLANLLTEQNISPSSFLERLIPLLSLPLPGDNIRSIRGNLYILHQRERDFFVQLLSGKAKQCRSPVIFKGSFGMGKTSLIQSIKNICLLKEKPVFELKGSSSLSLPLSGVKNFLKATGSAQNQNSTIFEDLETLHSTLKKSLIELLASSFDSVILIDNIHLLDKESAEMLLSVASEINIPFVASSNEEYSHSVHGVKSFTLKGFQFGEIEELFPFALAAGTGFKNKLWNSCQGNPFIYSEFLNSFLQNCTSFSMMYSDEVEHITLPFPSSLEEHYSHIMSSEGSQERSLIKFVSALEDGFDKSIPESFFGKDCSHKLLIELTEKGIFRLNHGNFTFSHSSFRNYVYDCLTTEEKEEIHGALATVLSQKNASATEQFYHWSLSGSTGKALAVGNKAVAELRKAFDYNRALYMLRVLINITEEEKRIPLYLQEGELLFLKGQYDECIKKCTFLSANLKKGEENTKVSLLLAESYKETGNYQSSLEILEKLPGQHKDEVAVQNLIGLNYWLLGNTEKAFQIFNNALKSLGKNRNADYGRTIGNLGVCSLYTGDLVKAEESLVQAVKLLKKYRLIPQYALNLSRLARLYKLAGKTEAAAKLYRRTLKIYSNMGDRTGACDEMLSLGCIYREEGKLKKAEKAFTEIIRTFGKRTDIQSMALAQFNLAVVRLETGELDYSEQIFLTHLKEDRKRGQKLGIGIDLAYLGILFVVRREWSEATKYFSEALEIFEELNNSEWQSFVLIYRAKQNIFCSDLEKAGKDITKAQNIMERSKTKLHQIEAEIVYAEYLFLCGKITECLAIAEKILLSTNPTFKVQALKIKALVLCSKGKNAEGKNLFLRALKKTDNPAFSYDILISIFKLSPEESKNLELEPFVETVMDFCRKFHIRNMLTELERFTGKKDSFKDPATILKTVRTSLDKGWENCTNCIEEILGTSAILASQFDPFGNICILSSSSNMKNEEGIVSQIIMKIAENGKAVFLSRENPELEELLSESITGGINSIIVCPLFRESHVAGLVYIDRREPLEEFTENELTALKMICELLSAFLSDSKVKTAKTPDLPLPSKYNMIGSSLPMKNVFDIISKAAPLNIPVLIYGSTGTGKELAAKAIHDASPRKNKPFVAINCAAVPENLIESELFGYRKGAFSGADRDRKGLMESADGGTFFMDEIGEMPLLLQAKLLRVIQEKKLRRLGDSEERKIDIRIVAATHRNLKNLISKKEFREDLYYRLNVLEINMPDLKDRGKDVRLLLQNFFRKFSEEMGKENITITPQVLAILENYSWPGNIREMENIVKSALARTGNENILTTEHLSDKFRNKEQTIDYKKEGKLTDLVDSFERNVIENTLNKCGQNKTEAARRLGITRQTLLNKLKKSTPSPNSNDKKQD